MLGNGVACVPTLSLECCCACDFAFCIVQVQDQRCTDDKEHAPFAGDGPTVPRSPFEDMKISLIDGARAKSDSRSARWCSVTSKRCM